MPRSEVDTAIMNGSNAPIGDHDAPERQIERHWRIVAIEERIGQTEKFIRYAWLALKILSGAILIILLLRITQAFLEKNFLSSYLGILANSGDFSAGTLGILATVLSIFYLIKNLQAGEKEVAIDAIYAGLERKRARLDYLLATRRHIFTIPEKEALPSMSKIDPGTEHSAALIEHVRKLLERAGHYARLDLQVNMDGKGQDIVGQIHQDLKDNFYDVAASDQYINHMSSIFGSIGYDEPSEKFLKRDVIDHIWNSLALDERALLFVCNFLDIAVPLPSDELRRVWQDAVEARLPWDGSRFGLDALRQGVN